jgi:hypothetical protein
MRTEAIVMHVGTMQVLGVSLFIVLIGPMLFGGEQVLGQGSVPIPASTANVEERLDSLEKKMDAPSLWKTLGLRLSGGVNISYTQNFNNPASNLNQLRIFDTNADAFMPNLAQIIFEKPADAGGSLLDRAGFRARMNFGLDARVTKARTNFKPGTSNDEVDLQELYAEYILPVGNGLKVQFGRINTLIGYEVIQSWDNPNFSRSFMFGLGQAFTTTGVRLTYQVNPMVLASVGVVNGWDNVDDNNRSKTAEWLLAVTPHERFSLSFYGSYGREQAAQPFGPGGIPTVLVGDPFGARLASGAIAIIKATAQTTIVLEPYYANEVNASLVKPGQNARWNGFAGYLIHDFTDQWSFRFRGEIFEDAGGSRTCGGVIDLAGGANTCFGATNVASAPPVAQTLWENTYTLQYKPVPSLITRLEFRYDKSNKNVFEQGSRATNHQETLSVSVVYLF